MADAASPASRRLLITGGAGFVGATLVREALEAGYRVRVLDALTYAGNLENLAEVEADVEFLRGDIADPDAAARAMDGIEVVVHAAAESHVDRSLHDAGVFLRTNIEGTRCLLAAARGAGVERFVQISTDEVYGDLAAGAAPFTEASPLAPSNPYSASKAGADLLALAEHRSFGAPVSITRCANNYGPWQFPEKLIPLMIARALEDQPLPVYGDGQQVRDWIHVQDHARGVLRVLERGQAGLVYNLGAENERTNLEVVHALLDALGKPHDLVRLVEDRPGHDRRYCTSIARARDELGYAPTRRWDEALPETVRWYLENSAWLARVQSGEYQEYYQRQYGARLGASS